SQGVDRWRYSLAGEFQCPLEVWGRLRVTALFHVDHPDIQNATGEVSRVRVLQTLLDGEALGQVLQREVMIVLILVNTPEIVQELRRREFEVAPLGDFERFLESLNGLAEVPLFMVVIPHVGINLGD